MVEFEGRGQYYFAESPVAIGPFSPVSAPFDIAHCERLNVQHFGAQHHSLVGALAPGDLDLGDLELCRALARESQLFLWMGGAAARFWFWDSPISASSLRSRS